MRSPSALAPALALALVFGACRHVTVKVRPGPPLLAQAVAVYPCEFRWEEPAYRSFEVSEALALQAMATGRYAVFGPGEFKLVRGSSDNPFVGTDITLQLADRGLSPMAALVVKPILERRSQSELKQVYDEKGRPKGAQRVEAARIVARIEVFHSSSREMVADASGAVDIDPLSPRDASDPMPEATALLKRMMDETLREVAVRAPGQGSERGAGFTYLFNPKAALDFTVEGKPPFTEALSKLDALEQDVALESRLRFFLAETDAATVTRLLHMPGGLYVTTVGAAGASGLAPGDLIVSVNGEPALPQALQRALRAALPGQPIPLRVRRSSGLADLALTP